MNILGNKQRYTRLFGKTSYNKSHLIVFLSLSILFLITLITFKLQYIHISNRKTLLNKSLIDTTSHQWRLNSSEYYADPNWDFLQPPTTRFIEFNISQIEANPDGVYRNLTVINGQFPGPLIEINENDTIILTINNQNSEPTSFHFHGIFYENQNYFDGVSQINQCPIPPYSSYTYNFTISNQHGSYWYHSHYKTQYADGLYGPLIVHSPAERPGLTTIEDSPYDYDMVVLLSDYYHDVASTYIKDYLAPQNENTEPVPDNGLIQGTNYFNCDHYSNDEESNKRCVQSDSGRYVLQVEPNKKYRLRLINVGAFAEIDFAIDSHVLKIIEIDGSSVEEYTTNKVSLPVGQRISVILSTDQIPKPYWIHSKLNKNCFAEKNERLDSDAKAVLYYIEEPTHDRYPISYSLEPTSSGYNLENQLCKEFNTSLLVPISNKEIPPSDLFIRLDIAFLIKDYAISKGYINNTSYEPLSKNTLFQELNYLKSEDDSDQFKLNGVQQQLLPEKNFIYTVNETKVIDVLINNLSDDAHPFHLHGHKFWVMKESSGNWKDQMFSSLPTKDVVMRDTINVGAYHFAVIRFETKNPGLWLFHCSMLWHMEAGLMMQFNFLPEVYSKWEIPSNWYDICLSSVFT